MIPVIAWLVIAAAAIVGEVLTTAFFLIFFAVGAVAALILSFVPFIPVEIEIAAFLIVSVASMLILRPPLIERFARRNSHYYPLSDNVVGRRGIVTRAIGPESVGMVRLDGGEFWSAEAVHSGKALAEGTRVDVLATRGVTALVEPAEDGFDDLRNERRASV